MGTEKQGQRRCNDARLTSTESRNTRSKQLLVMPMESLTNRECLPEELLSRSERRSRHRRRKILKVGGAKDMIVRAKNFRPRPLQVKPRPFLNDRRYCD